MSHPREAHHGHHDRPGRRPLVRRPGRQRGRPRRPVTAARGCVNLARHARPRPPGSPPRPGRRRPHPDPRPPRRAQRLQRRDGRQPGARARRGRARRLGALHDPHRRGAGVLGRRRPQAHAAARRDVRRRTPSELRRRYIDGIQRIPRRLALAEKPIVAAINGPAIGAGLDLACMCDLRLAARGAQLGSTFVKVGLVPGDGGAYFLARTVGFPRALELMLTARLVDADEAERIGLVHRVVEPAELLPAATHARRAAGQPTPPLALRLTKRAAYRSHDADLEHALELAATYQGVVQNTADHARPSARCSSAARRTSPAGDRGPSMRCRPGSGPGRMSTGRGPCGRTGRRRRRGGLVVWRLMHRDDLPPDPPGDDDAQTEDPDRAAILARRKRFIAIALSGLASGVGCAEPCLKVAAPPSDGNEQKADPPRRRTRRRRRRTTSRRPRRA
jgi:enoyl-CoA hydratase/carnithine racemase